MTILRHALRSLFGTPSVTGLIVLTLALGIGMTTAVFSVVEAVLLRPLPFPEADRLVVVWEYRRDRPEGSHGVGRNVVGPGNYLRWKERLSSFDGLTLFLGGHGTLSVPLTRTVSGPVEPERVPAAIVHGSFFRTLGVVPALGRAIEPGDGVPGAEPVVVLSDAWWRSRLGGDPDVVGRTLDINGTPTTIVGVADGSLDLPHGARFWTAWQMDEAAAREQRGRSAAAIGRLAPGLTIERAREELSSVAAALERETPDRNAGWTTSVVPLEDELVASVRPAVTTVALAVGFVLVVGCVNVVNLLLARALGHHRDVAVRLALGAPARRIVGQAVLEGGILAGCGGLLGILLAWGVLAASEAPLHALLATNVPARLNPVVLAFGIGMSLVTGLVFGVVPAWVATHRIRIGALADGRTVSSGRAVGTVRSTLVVSQIALALLLLLGAGALVRGYWELTRVDPGFEAAQVVSLRAAPTGDTYRDRTNQVAYFERMIGAMDGLPNVEAVGAISVKPLGTGGAATSYHVVGQPPDPPDLRRTTDIRVVTPGLLDTLRVPLLNGRFVTGSDTADTPPVMVVNRAFVRDLPSDVDPVGQAVELAWFGGPVWTIVGVVGDVHLAALDRDPRPAVYLPLPQTPVFDMTVVARVRGDVHTAIGELRTAVAGIDPRVPITDVETLDDTVAASIGRPRVLSAVLGTLAGAGLLLALVGLYGVLSHSVQQRLREIGVRIAVGAGPRDVVALVVRDGLRLILIGGALGLGLALTGATLLERVLAESVHPDLSTGVVVVLLLCGVGLLAAAIPAWRASRVDPVTVLRD